MDLDMVTVSVMTAVVVVTAGVAFIVETVLREDDAAGRIWSIGFLSGILSTVSYAVWAYDPELWGAVAVGNAAFVATTGFLWLGCRRFNGRSAGWAEAVVAVLTVATGLAVVIAGPDGGGWAGAPVMFFALFLLPTAAAWETVHGSIAGNRTSLGLTVVFSIQALYYLGRLIVLLTFGAESDTFTEWWGTLPTSILTIVLTLVVVIIASVMRAERVGFRGRRRPDSPRVLFSGVLEPDWFQRFVDDGIERAESRGEIVAVIATRIDDLALVGTAFGSSEADVLREAWYQAVRLHAPTQGLIGDDGHSGIVVSAVVDSEADARRLAARLHRAIYDALHDVEASVIPVLGVGVTLNDSAAADAASLVEAARAAAGRSALSDDTSVIVVH